MSELPDQVVVYQHGKLIRREAATVDIEDRGNLFGDAVYEVLRCYRGQPLELESHVLRLQRSLHEVLIPEPPDVAQLGRIITAMVKTLKCDDAVVYVQVSRGAAPRNVSFAAIGPMKPTVFATARPAPKWRPAGTVPAVRAITTPDIRWHRCDIKTVMLLPAVLATAEAQKKGAQIAIFHRDGRITEANSSNIGIVRNGEIWTPPADNWILPGITRMLTIQVASDAGLVIHERAFEMQKLKTADEVFVMGTTSHVTAVTHIDGHAVHGGAIGPITRQLSDLLGAHIDKACPATKA